MKSLSRRQFVTSTILGAAALGVGCKSPLFGKSKIPVGLQLYSVRQDCEKDLPKVIETVSKIGYKGVEFAGYYGRKAPELRAMLDANGLVCCGTHTQLDDLKPEKVDATLDFNQTLGNKFVICPWMDPKTKEGWLAMVKMFNDLYPKVEARKMHLGYHAHAHDFHQLDGVSCWDLFFGNTNEKVVMQLDTSNCMDGGADPVVILKKYIKRAKSIHIKEWGGTGDAVIGEGKVNFPAVFDLCEKSGVTEWYVVEHEREGNAIESVRRCYGALQKFGKV